MTGQDRKEAKNDAAPVIKKQTQILCRGSRLTRAVIFDLYETLITHYNSPLYFGSAMAKDAGIEEDRFYEIWHSTEHDRTVGKITFEEVIEKILRENGRYSEDLLHHIVSNRRAVKADCFSPLHAEILPLLHGLKDRGLRLGLISNCFSEEAEIIRQSELFSFFDAALLSWEQGVAKPDREIFSRCLSALSLPAEDCLYLGDGGSSELEAAEKAGMRAFQAVWYFREENPRYPSRRNPAFRQIQTPLEVLQVLDEESFCF